VHTVPFSFFCYSFGLLLPYKAVEKAAVHRWVVGSSKRFLLEQMDRDHFEDVKRWLIDKRTGGGSKPLDRPVTDAEVHAAEGQYELDVLV